MAKPKRKYSKPSAKRVDAIDGSEKAKLGKKLHDKTVEIKKPPPSSSGRKNWRSKGLKNMTPKERAKLRAEREDRQQWRKRQAESARKAWDAGKKPPPSSSGKRAWDAGKKPPPSKQGKPPKKTFSPSKAANKAAKVTTDFKKKTSPSPRAGKKKLGAGRLASKLGLVGFFADQLTSPRMAEGLKRATRADVGSPRGASGARTIGPVTRDVKSPSSTGRKMLSKKEIRKQREAQRQKKRKLGKK